MQKWITGIAVAIACGLGLYTVNLSSRIASLDALVKQTEIKFKHLEIMNRNFATMNRTLDDAYVELLAKRDVGDAARIEWNEVNKQRASEAEQRGNREQAIAVLKSGQAFIEFIQSKKIAEEWCRVELDYFKSEINRLEASAK